MPEATRSWTERDVLYVERHYPNVDTIIIAKHLGRSIKSIRAMAHKRGVTKAHSKGGETTSRTYMAGRLGIARTTDIAERAAGYIMSKPKAQCVCIDPHGRVTVHPVSESEHPDAIGVYSARDGLKVLYDSVLEDLTSSRE